MPPAAPGAGAGVIAAPRPSAGARPACRSPLAAVAAMLADEPYCRAELYERLEIHRWRFGGRR